MQVKKLSWYDKLMYKKYLRANDLNKIGNWNNEIYKQNYNEYLLDYKNLYKNVKSVAPLNKAKFKNTGVIYQVLTYSFADGNNDGIGDFIGLKEKLDYIDNLGVDQIWLSPLHPSPSYHGYGVIDYTKVAKQLGGMEAFREFLEAAHHKGIKVYLDLVFNHTSYEHPWFQAALNGDEYYQKFYQFDIKHYDADVKQDSEVVRKRFWNIQKQAASNLKYIGRFWAGMPDLNLNNKDVIEQLIAIQQYWIAVGVDGFRYDAIAEFFSSENEEKTKYNEAKIFYELRQASNKLTKKLKRDEVYMIGEWIGSSPLKALKYLIYKGSYGLNTTYDGYKYFALNPDVRVNYSDTKKIVELYENVHSKSGWVPFLDNHDMLRWIDNYRIQAEKLSSFKLNQKITAQEIEALHIALLSLFALPGQPILYYGDELNYYGTRKYGDPSLREPLRWNNQKFNCFFSNSTTNADYTYVLQTYSRHLNTVENIINEPNSTYKLIQTLTDLRIKYPFLKETKSSTFLNPELVVDTTDPTSFILRKDEQKNKYLLFAFCNYQNTKIVANKISRDFHFKELFSYQATNHSWNLEIAQGGYIVYELTEKLLDEEEH
ncbi:alpha-amylase family glycosyl hydrolase [Mycoplasma hafezii]|uniref:alpha-amylase family glycosyl hydrolase n=1 Tax=Mycoplasma hafezii TaxID=525886 RepID=UPI003CFA6724